MSDAAVEAARLVNDWVRTSGMYGDLAKAIAAHTANLTARLASATEENERMLKCLRTLHDQCFNAGYSVDEYHDAMTAAGGRRE